MQVMYGAFVRKISNIGSMCDQPWGAGSFHCLKLCIVRIQSMCRTPSLRSQLRWYGSDRKGLMEIPRNS